MPLGLRFRVGPVVYSPGRSRRRSSKGGGGGAWLLLFVLVALFVIGVLVS